MARLSDRDRVCLECKLPGCWEKAEGCLWWQWAGKRGRTNGRIRWGWLQEEIEGMGAGERREFAFVDARELRRAQNAAKDISRGLGCRVSTHNKGGGILEVRREE